jgi:hypothetical protein
MSETSAGNSSSSKSLMFMTLALFGGFGVMLGGGLFIAKRLAQTMGLAAATGTKDTVRTPIGAFRMEKEDQVGPGLPVYPRAALEVPGDVATGQALRDSKNGVVVVTYHTGDTREFVESWYMKHLSPEFSRHQGSETTFPPAFRNVSIDTGDIAFLAERNSNARAVTLSEDSTGTKISLIQSSSPAASASPSTTAPQ